MHLSPSKTALAVGIFLGGWHLLWSLLVLVGWAQPLLDFIFNLHMIAPVYQVQAFDWTRALGLIVITAIIGYIIGYAFALIWNKLHRA